MQGMHALGLNITRDMFRERRVFLCFDFASALATGIQTFILSSLSHGSDGSAYRLGGYEMLLGI